MQATVNFDSDDIIGSAVEGNLFHFQQLVGSIIDMSGDVAQLDSITDDKGNTPLLLAYKNNHPAIVDELLLFGCSADVENSSGESLRTLFLQHSGSDYMKAIIRSYLVSQSPTSGKQVLFDVILDEFSKEYIGRKVFNFNRYVNSQVVSDLEGTVHEAAIHLYEEVHGATHFIDTVFKLSPWEERPTGAEVSDDEVLFLSTVRELGLPSRELKYGETVGELSRCTQAIYRLYAVPSRHMERAIGRAFYRGESVSGIRLLKSEKAKEVLSVEYLNDMKQLIFGHELEHRRE